MAFTAGNFDDAAIANIIIEEQALFGQGSRMTELNKEVTAGLALLQHQTPTIRTIGEGTSCMGATIYTMRSGSLDSGTKEMTCSLDSTVKHGTEGITLSKQALVNFSDFKIQDDLCQNQADFEKQFAYLYAKAKSELEVKLSRMMISMLAANVDAPPAADQWETPGNVVGSIFQVAKDNFDVSLLGDLELHAKRNGISDPLILNGSNFFHKKIMNEFASVGCCTNDDFLNSNKYFNIILYLNCYIMLFFL